MIILKLLSMFNANLSKLHVYHTLFHCLSTERTRGKETEKATGAAAGENGQLFQGWERRSEFKRPYGH